MLSISRASSMAALRGDILSSTNFFAYLSLTVYLTVYDSLSLWYCAKGMVQKSHRNRHFSDSQMSGNGFRGRIQSSLQGDVANTTSELFAEDDNTHRRRVD